MAQALERLLQLTRGFIRVLYSDALEQVARRDHVPRACGGDHLTEQPDGRGPQIAGHLVQRLAEIVLEQSLRALGLEQRVRVVALPQPQADRLHFREAELRAPKRAARTATGRSLSAGDSSRAK